MEKFGGCIFYLNVDIDVGAQNGWS